MRRVNYYLSKVQIEDLKRISNITGLSVSEHIRRAVDLYVKEWDEQKVITREILEQHNSSR